MDLNSKDPDETSAQTLRRYPRADKLTEDDIAAFARLESPLIDSLARWLNKRLTCADCLKCTRRCEVLETPGLHIGEIEATYDVLSALDADSRSSALFELFEERPELYAALRRCSFCGYCTAPCSVNMNAPERMRVWRELFADAAIMPPNDSKLVMVDNEWHIFSAYRAIYGVAYPEFVVLEDLADRGVDDDSEVDTTGVDTLFFPGCSLASYAPDVVRAVGRCLDGLGIGWALSLDCCGSPLMSAGLFERSIALRQKVLSQIKACGIKRVVTVCPGCGEELSEVFGEDVEVVPLPELLSEHRALPPSDADGGTMTIFDSCHDRFDTRHGRALRELVSAGALGSGRLREMPHHGKETLCCGAGGSVATYDAVLSEKRVRRVIDEAAQTGADILVTVCPTCTYTIAQAQLANPDPEGIACRHYLELLLGVRIPWDEVFARLELMWTGEYGPWLAETFF
jgi:Fe-S oxidoreductase